MYQVFSPCRQINFLRVHHSRHMDSCIQGDSKQVDMLVAVGKLARLAELGTRGCLDKLGFAGSFQRGNHCKYQGCIGLLAVVN